MINEIDIQISKIAEVFGISGIKDCETCNIGHINGTYFADSDIGKLVVQKINTNIFKDPVGLMENIVGVTSHIREKYIAEGKSEKEIERSVLNFCSTPDGKHIAYDENGGAWRIYKYIGDSRTYNSVNGDLLCESGRCFGLFQNYLADFPAEKLHETIPYFHDTARRFAHFEESVKADAFSRAKECPDLIEKVLSYRDVAPSIVNMLASGELPNRVIHNDTKINNVLFDLKTQKSICVIDLDTVMPGTLLYDFGDAIRSGASAVPEGSLEFDSFKVRFDLYKAFYDGFSAGVCGKMTKIEEENLPLGAFMMTYEVGMRFLDDYLSGDTYFHTDYKGQNLDRARGQLLLADDIMKNREKLVALTK